MKSISKRICVVETNDGKVYLGRLKVTNRSFTVYSGFAGRPPVIPAEEIDEVTLAESHPDVVMT